MKIIHEYVEMKKNTKSLIGKEILRNMKQWDDDTKKRGTITKSYIVQNVLNGFVVCQTENYRECFNITELYSGEFNIRGENKYGKSS